MNRFNCLSLLRHCESLKQLQEIHGQAITQGSYHQFQPLACKILNKYARFGRTTDAQLVFGQIRDPDVVSLTSLMAVHLQTNQPRLAVAVFSEILISGRRPDGFAVVGAVTASGRIGDLCLGRSVHGMVYRRELGYETVVSNALIDMYCGNGKFHAARMVFGEMHERDAVTWSSMLNGYVKCKGLASAYEFFELMPKRDTVSWTVMVTGYVQGGQPVRALEMFRLMKSEGHHPTLITMVGVLSACADTDAVDLGRAIHGYVSKTIDVSSDVSVYNSLIDMYVKSGNVEVAYEIFSKMALKDVYTWTSMILGFAIHGDGNRALEIFLEMINSNIMPNEVTFVAVLSACSHVGFIDEGRKWFERMWTVYGLKPRLEHFGCMVDLLGRAGRLREAEMLIEEMESDPDTVIWRSMLSACLVHGNTRLAEVAGKKIIEQEPDDDGVYVLLWNMYASSNRWEEALEMRKKMRTRKVLKKPGCSWIEVEGLVHEFFVEDKVHFHRKEIYELLKGIANHLKMCTNIHNTAEGVDSKDFLFI